MLWRLCSDPSKDGDVDKISSRRNYHWPASRCILKEALMGVEEERNQDTDLRVCVCIYIHIFYMYIYIFLPAPIGEENSHQLRWMACR